MSHKKYITKNLIALIVIGAVFSGTVLTFGNFSPNTLKTLIPYGPTASYRIAFGPSTTGMPAGINISKFKDLPTVVSIMNKMGYKIPTLTSFAGSIQPHIPEIETGTPSMELMGIIMSTNPAAYVSSTEGITMVTELKKDLSTAKEITDILKFFGCTSECNGLDDSYRNGMDAVQTEQPGFAALNISDFVKDAIKIAPGLVPSEKPENVGDIAKKFEWLIGKSNALEFDNAAIKASLIKLNNLGNKKVQEDQPKITAPSGGGNGGGGGGSAVVGGGAMKVVKEKSSKVKSSEKSIKKSESKSKEDKSSKKSVKKSESKSKVKSSEKSIKKSESKSKVKSSEKSIKKSESKSKVKSSKKSVKKSKSKFKDKSSSKKFKSKTKKKSSEETPSI